MSLVNQRSTEEMRQQIKETQGSANGIVAAIGTMSQVMKVVNDIVDSITRACEEQMTM
jgi:hypothetical protein